MKVTVFSKFSKYGMYGMYGLIGSLVILASCKGSLNSEDSGVKATTSTQVETQECPTTPGGSLTDPTSIDIMGKTVQKSGSLRSKDNIGFTFSGKQGQKLNYSYNDEVCVWIFAPDNTILSGTELPTDGIYMIHVASLKGTTSFDIEVGLSEPTIVQQATPAPTQVVVVQQPPTQVNSQPIQQTPQPYRPPQPTSSTVDFTQNEAVGLVSGWLSQKGRVFSHPFDLSPAQQYISTSGPLYHDISKPDGSVDWLRKNNAYYQYRESRITEVSSYYTSGSMPELVVSIYEDKTLNTPKGVDSTVSGSSTQTFVYSFVKENGTWKIFDYREGN